jgi:glycerate kinase
VGRLRAARGAGSVPFVRPAAGHRPRDGGDRLPRDVSRADLVITGEGRIDAQTAFGKTALGVAKRARPLRACRASRSVAGSRSMGIRALAEVGRIAVPVVERPMSIEESMAAGAALLERCGERLARLVSTW